MSDYKIHARRDGATTLCNQAIVKPTSRGEQNLPLAWFPCGITCRNCLTIYYGENARK